MNCILFHRITLQPNNGNYVGTGANDFTFFIENKDWNRNQDRGFVQDMEIGGNILASGNPSDLEITMICYVGVDGCSVSSTAETFLNGPNDPITTLADTKMSSNIFVAEISQTDDTLVITRTSLDGFITDADQSPVSTASTGLPSDGTLAATPQTPITTTDTGLLSERSIAETPQTPIATAGTGTPSGISAASNDFSVIPWDQKCSKKCTTLLIAKWERQHKIIKNQLID